MNMMKNIFRGGAVVLSAVLLSSCAAITFVKPDGTTDKLVWPQWDKVRFDNGQGIFPNRDNLDQIAAGMSKDQLYYLIGRPHYDDAWRPVEWNYLFYFRTPNKGTDNVSTCQYKVLFDKDMIARNFYWNPIDPVNGSCPPAP